tara:strand:- start:63 stop:785 length:723 start_codon:yes stop_codon:yes gene_type:complete
MSIWGKLIVGTAGFAVGGPIGALFGTAAGHALDEISFSSYNNDQKNIKSLAFTGGLIALSAKMAKADGIVTKDEVITFKKLVDIPSENIRDVGRIWELAKTTIDGYDSYAYQMSKLFQPRSPILEKVLDLLFEIAKSDGVITNEELDYLNRVAEIFGIDEKTFDRLSTFHNPDSNPYSILGVDEDTSFEQIKKHWKILVNKNHPDRLIGDGMPEEFIQTATKKLTLINEAYFKISEIHKI